MFQARKLPLFAESNDAAPLVVSPQGNVTSMEDWRQKLRAEFRVALVSMPFHSVAHPSLQLGLLQSIGESHGFPVDTFHLGLDLARRVGVKLYEELSQSRGRQFGDWLFSVQAFGDAAPDRTGQFVTEFAADVADQLGEAPGTASSAVNARVRLTALHLRNEVVPAFLDAMVAETDWSQYKVVGFTSVFQQTAASIALARRIKSAHPNVKFLFGGSNFDGEMGLELIERLDVMDHVVVGEGDLAFPELLVALAEGKNVAKIPGVASRIAGQVTYGGHRKPFEALDELPTPNYDEYFSRAEANGLLSPTNLRTTAIPFESARGCWWGEKHHCTFCGLNNNGMKFRSKSPKRVAAELAELARRNRSFVFEAVDNIVDHDYINTFFPQLVESKHDYSFFYEVKSNLSRERIRDMRAAGVKRVQPGIESLNSHVLRLMRKGVTAAQNVNTLRWGIYYGMGIGWNILWGFPGETEADYVAQAKLLRNLRHLQPPVGGGPIWMERFSPLYSERESFPLEYIRPEKSYEFVYPSNVNLDKIAYFFDYKLHNTLDKSTYDQCRTEVRAWKDAWEKTKADASVTPPGLVFWSSEEFLQISDTRSSTHSSVTFEGPHAQLYLAATEQPVTVNKVLASTQLNFAPEDVERAMDEFCEQNVMMRDGDKFLALALPFSKGR